MWTAPTGPKSSLSSSANSWLQPTHPFTLGPSLVPRVAFLSLLPVGSYMIPVVHPSPGGYSLSYCFLCSSIIHSSIHRYHLADIWVKKALTASSLLRRSTSSSLRTCQISRAAAGFVDGGPPEGEGEAGRRLKQSVSMQAARLRARQRPSTRGGEDSLCTSDLPTQHLRKRLGRGSAPGMHPPSSETAPAES